MGQIQRAVRVATLLRLTLGGPPKSGKSCTGLKLLRGLVDRLAERKMLPGSPSLPGYGRIGVIDAGENDSCLKYAVVPEKLNDPTYKKLENERWFDFDYISIFQPFTLKKYVDAITEFENAGYAGLMIDQLSSAWNGIGGLLEENQRFADARSDRSTYAAWHQTNALYAALVSKINSPVLHTIAITRAKNKHIQRKNSSGKTEIVKVGVKPEARPNWEHEFDGSGMMTWDHDLIMSEFRNLPELGLRTFTKPGMDLGRILADYLCDGVVLDHGDLDTKDNIPSQQVTEIQNLSYQLGFTDDDIRDALLKYGVTRIGHLAPAQASDICNTLRRRVASAEVQAKGEARRLTLAQPDPKPNGVPVQQSTPVPPPDRTPTYIEITELARARGYDADQWNVHIQSFGVNSIEELTDDQLSTFREQITSEPEPVEDVGDTLVAQLVAQSPDRTPIYDRIKAKAKSLGYTAKHWDLHISTFSVESIEDMDESILQAFESEVDGLVVDRDSNPAEFDINGYEFGESTPEPEPEPEPVKPEPNKRQRSRSKQK